VLDVVSASMESIFYPLRCFVRARARRRGGHEEDKQRPCPPPLLSLMILLSLRLVGYDLMLRCYHLTMSLSLFCHRLNAASASPWAPSSLASTCAAPSLCIAGGRASWTVTMTMVCVARGDELALCMCMYALACFDNVNWLSSGGVGWLDPS